jgi:peptide/nickel transport system substrate-binding protein
MKNKKRLSYLIVCLILLGLFASGCGTTTEPAATEAPVVEEETTATEPTEAAPEEETTAPESEEAAPNIFVYVYPTSFPDIDPAVSFSNDSAITSNCYETLTFYNPPGSDEVLSPGLATSWETNEDSTEWIFHLREGVTFHNGDPLNAEAVKGAFENTMEVGLGAAYLWDPIAEIEVVDEYTVKFVLSYAAPLDLVVSSGYGAWIYNPTVYQEKGTEWFNEGNCAGTGPYTIESRARGSRLVMTRFEEYWGGWHDGQFDKVVFEVAEDATVIQQMIESGTADFAYGVAPDNLESLAAKPDLVVYQNPSFQNFLGLMNVQKPPLDDKLVRQALSYSVPYDLFIEGVMGDRAVQARGPVPSGMFGHGENLHQYSYDLDKARELLTEAGYPDGNFDLLYTFAAGDLDEQQFGEVWKAELAKLGINLELREMNWEAQWDLGMSDPQEAQDIFAFYWWPDYVSPYTFLYGMFHSEEEITFNLGYYRNTEYDEMIDEANTISGSDKQKAEEMFIQAQEILIEDAAALFIYDIANLHVARADIKGFVDNPGYPHVVFAYQLTRE